MKSKFKWFFAICISVVCIICASVFAVPKVVLDASSRALTTTEQSELNRLLNYKVLENNEDLFRTTKYSEVVSNISSYIYSYRTFKEQIEANELDVSSLDIETLENKNTVANNIGSRLENYLKAVYIECNSFKNTAMGYDYNLITIEDKDAVQTVKNKNLKFWGETVGEIDGKIYLTYAENAYRDESTVDSAAKLVSDATKNIDKCLNKLIALEEYPSKLAYFTEEIAKLPPIVDITEKDRELLNKLSKEINEYCDQYAVHLDDENKTKFENFKWQIDKSLDQLSDGVNTTAIFWIALIAIIGFSVFVLIKYLIIPFVSKKFKGRKK